MPKKAGKKGKGKKKGKEKKGGLTNREREIYLLTIGELEHKIEWRNHFCIIMEEDMKLFHESLQLHQTDKKEAIKILEQSIEKERELIAKIQRALPEAENVKNQEEEGKARELAAKLLKMNQEKLSNNAELQVLRKKLKSLETYIPNKTDDKIKEIEKELESEDIEDVFLKAEKQYIRRKETFRQEMQDILKGEVDSYQAEITGKLDKKFERITEETRWWADRVNGLRIATERLEAVNDIESPNLRSAQRELKHREKISVEESKKLQEMETIMKGIKHRNLELESVMSKLSEQQDYMNFLHSTVENLKRNLDVQDEHLMECLNQIEMNEIEAKELEEKVSNEVFFADQLKEYMKKAHQLVMEEVKRCLIVTYDGPPPETNTLVEMRNLFEEATKFIYERKNKSII